MAKTFEISVIFEILRSNDASKVALIRFGSGRFGVLSPFNESHSGLLLSLLPPQHLLPPYVPDLEKLTTVPCFNDQCDDLVIKEEAGEPASYAVNGEC
ncbi:unnamed protein product, partial [Mesorhabditis belari]|uniref:Uncharacterized protein n=1 Tax=Mesorhabditis belari TaxID=2138241 RepID=A0AAF3ES26_9BILA